MKIYLVENCYHPYLFKVEHFKDVFSKRQDAYNAIKRAKTIYKNKGWTIVGSGSSWFEATKQGIRDYIASYALEVNDSLDIQ